MKNDNYNGASVHTVTSCVFASAHALGTTAKMALTSLSDILLLAEAFIRSEYIKLHQILLL